jgi:coenzyme F420-reducing hydrogenase delta subunit
MPGTEPDPGVFAEVRDFAVQAARSVAMVDPTIIQQAIDEADRALVVGPILDPTLFQRGQAELEQQTQLLRALLHFRLRLEAFRPGAST